MSGKSLKIKTRVTGVLIENDQLLLVKQKVNSARGWSLPGGTLEFGETLAECMIREMREETGLQVVIEKLLYICDRIEADRHVLHITFMLQRIGGSLQLGYEPETFANPITDIQMVPIIQLPRYGFTEQFCNLVRLGFPNHGSYMGSIENIGL